MGISNGKLGDRRTGRLDGKCWRSESPGRTRGGGSRPNAPAETGELTLGDKLRFGESEAGDAEVAVLGSAVGSRTEQRARSWAT